MTPGTDEFSDFREAVSRYFAPLASDSALGSAVERSFGFEIHIDFSSAISRLGIALELGGVPWVSVGIVTGGREHLFGLHTLIEDAEGPLAPVTQIETLPSTDTQVRALAELTRRYATNFLKGDDSRVPSLRVVRAKAYRERNRVLTGTPTGGPLLDHRPTLSDLFAEARGAEFPADVRLAYVHSAVWDHEYSIDEVSAFLGIRSADVQRIVDALDNVTDEPLETLRAIVGRE